MTSQQIVRERGKRTRTLWGVWTIKPEAALKRLRQALPCSIDHGLSTCEQEAYWTYNGNAMCDECIEDCAGMNDDNAHAFLPALKEIATLQHRKLCSVCKIHLSEDDFYGDPCLVRGKPACHPCQYIYENDFVS